ncbi:hypothetical protein Scep_023811 [Stephania cephalantha]|uniref:Uncharacterized protein n=1 Tax=Stephania cephalantha TaxID=152367 RepID=A0AAP0HXP2_9MAGN
MAVSMESVRGINVPMYTTLRRTTVAFTMAMEYLLTRKNYSFSVFCDSYGGCEIIQLN